MDFGLGLVLSFTDNATAGINSAVNSLNQLTQVAENAGNSLNEFASLSAFSSIATSVGNSMTSMGTNIISTFGQIIGKVNQTGQTLMYAENQLSKLYEGSGKTGKDVLADITQYAKTSIFEFEDLIPVVTMLKANGIEAFDMIASSTGNANQTLMDYAADLAAFNPQMKNAYGTGIKAAMGALNEYIAEGNAMSLKRGASLDITGLLGEEKGATIEERSRQVADLMEKLNMVGMTAQLAQSPMTKLSNMSDTLFQFIGMISQSGVYDAFNEIIDVFSSFVMSIDDSTLQNVASIVGDALSALLKPVQQLAQWIVKLADGFIKLVESNPALAKFTTIATAIAGVLLVVGGVALKFAGSIGYLTLMLKSLSTSFGAIGTVMKAGATKIVGALVPVTLALGVMYLVWKNDLFGIRTLVTSFVQNVVNSFKTAKTAVSGSLADMQATLKTFDTQNSFFDGLTLAIMRVMVLFQALAEGWNDYTLSDETFAKAKELGILPLIEALFNLKYRFDLFKQGFIAGWEKISEKVKGVINDLIAKADGTIFEDLLKGVTSFFEALSSNDADAWYKFGESFAYITAGVIAFVAVFKTVSKVVSIISSVINVISKVAGAISKVIGFVSKVVGAISKFAGAIGHFISDIVGFFQLVAEFGLHETLVGLFGTVATTIAGIASTVAGAVLAVINFFDMLKNGFSWLKEILMVVGVALAAIGAIILGAPALIAGIVAGIVALVATLVVVIKEHWQQICDFFSMIGTWIYNNVIKPVADFFVGLWNGIVTGVTTAISAVKSFLSTIAMWLYTNVIQPVVNFFMTYIYPFIEKIAEIVAKIIEIVTTLVSVGVQFLVSKFLEFVNWINTNVVQPVIQFFTNLWNGIVSVFSTIAEWFTTQFTNAVNGIKTAFSVVGEFFSGIWNSITTTFANVASWFGGVFSSAVEAIKSFFSPLGEFFQGVWNNIVSIFTTIGAKISDAISGAVKGAINTVLSGAAGIINGFISAINAAISVINAIPGVSISKISPLEVPALAKGGIIESPTTALIGEAGTEAVMPLENNTGWIGVLASMITQEMRNIRPTNTNEMNTTNNEDTTNRYLTTNNNTNSSTVQGDTDNSINFNEGAIQITVQNASEEEAMRLAKMIMEYIKRQKQLDRMMNYA